jgi:hypothetical protein
MNQHTPPPGPVPASRNSLPWGRAKLVALEVAAELAAEIHRLRIPHPLAHLRDHLVRAADNTMLRLSEASGRTRGNRTQHLEAAYAENQEVQSDLLLLAGRGVRIPPSLRALADRVGGLVYGLLRAEGRR